MKRNNNYTALLVVLLLAVVALALWGCSKSETAYANFTPEDFLSLDNFTLKTNVRPDDVMRYVKKDGALYYSSTHVGESHTNTVYYVFDNGNNREYSEGIWKDIEDADAEKYVATINTACGLVYNKLDPSQFREIPGKKLMFSVDPEQFFKQAYRQIYQTYFGTDYDEENFAQDFEENADTLFGDLNGYEIVLDCSKADSIVLSIENSKDKSSDVYEYYAIGSTGIVLPD